jgi:uncharacterized OB-fold protein
MVEVLGICRRCGTVFYFTKSKSCTKCGSSGKDNIIVLGIHDEMEFIELEDRVKELEGRIERMTNMNNLYKK